MGLGISIVVTYRKNKERFLGECLASIKEQTHPVDEVVIVEDCLAGEKPGPIDIIPRTCSQYLNGQLQVVRQADRQIGKAAQINRGVEAATQHYIGICSGDDYYEPTMIEKSLRSLESTGADVAWSNYNVVDEMRAITSTYNAAEKVGPALGSEAGFRDKTREWGGSHGMFSCLATWFAPRQVFLDIPFDEELKLNEDLEWLLRAVLVENKRFTYIPEVLANYRVSAVQASCTLKRGQLQLHNRYTWSKINMLLGEEVFPPPKGPVPR